MTGNIKTAVRDLGKSGRHSFGMSSGFSCSYHNGNACDLVQYVCSGDELLHRVERGVWVRTGPCGPE